MAVSAGLAAGAAAAKIFNTWYNSNSAKKAAAASYAYNIASMNHQYQLTRELNRNAYQDTTYSMREAGINPMLAITQGINGLSAGAGANISQQAAQSDMDLSSALALKNDRDRVENETEARKSQVSLNKSQENLNQYSADNQHEQAAYTNQQNRLLNTYGDQQQQLQLANTAKQGALLDAQRADVQNQIINRNLATNSAIQLNNATAKFTNERSRGFSDSHTESLGGFSVHGTHTRSRTW